MCLDKVSKKEVEVAIHKLNSRPRKVLGFKTPHEPFTPPFRTSANYSNEFAAAVPNLDIDPVAIPFGSINSQTRG